MNLTNSAARYFIETLLTQAGCAWSNGEALTTYSVERWWRNSCSILTTGKKENSLFFKTSRSALGPIQTPAKRLAVSVLPRIKQLRQESDHSLHVLSRLGMSGSIPPQTYAFLDFMGTTELYCKRWNLGKRRKESKQRIWIIIIIIIHTALLLCYWEFMF